MTDQNLAGKFVSIIPASVRAIYTRDAGLARGGREFDAMHDKAMKFGLRVVFDDRAEDGGNEVLVEARCGDETVASFYLDVAHIRRVSDKAPRA
jgi:hypothetical protein